MPRNKDQKKLIRSRMRKTGEAYTAARRHVVDTGGAAPPKAALPRRDWPALAGMADEKVAAKTGRTWSQWVDVLDAERAFEWPHRDIAKHLRDTDNNVDAWWAQSVTVGYERIRGLRAVGQQRSGAYEANKSRTFSVDVSSLYGMFKDPRRRKKWIDDGWVRIRTSTADKSIRVDWDDGTQANFFFESKGPAKSTVTVQQKKLTCRADIDTKKIFWTERFDQLRTVLRNR